MLAPDAVGGRAISSRRLIAVMASAAAGVQEGDAASEDDAAPADAPAVVSAPAAARASVEGFGLGDGEALFRERLMASRGTPAFAVRIPRNGAPAVPSVVPSAPDAAVERIAA